jgi:hypothetical protein
MKQMVLLLNSSLPIKGLMLTITAVYLATLPDGGAQGLFFAEMRKFGGPIQLQW